MSDGGNSNSKFDRKDGLVIGLLLVNLLFQSPIKQLWSEKDLQLQNLAKAIQTLDQKDTTQDANLSDYKLYAANTFQTKNDTQHSLDQINTALQKLSTQINDLNKNHPGGS